MKLFLDIGAHHGETARVALEPEFGFDRVCCFDPDPCSWGYLEVLQQTDPRVEFYPFGLWNKNVTVPIYGTGRVGCTLFADKPVGRRDRVGEGVFIKVSDWMASNVSSDDFMIAKLNCEGCECDILDNLMDEDMLEHVHAFYVDFDVRKIPSQAHRQNEVLKRLLHQHPLPLIVGPEDVPHTTHEENTRHWLRMAGVGA